MKVESNVRPTQDFEIEKNIDGTCDVILNDLDSIEEVETINEDGTITITYKYYSFRIQLTFNENVSEYVKANFKKLYDNAKEYDRDKVAQEVRARRNALLDATDKDMAFDRLGITLPENITMTNIISVIKDFAKALGGISKSDIARYRQELRDITKQEGFPYDVVFPTKPE